MDAPVATRLQLQFDDDGHRVRITSITNLKRDWEAGGTRPRLAAAREAILAGRDEWTNRFTLIDTQTRRVTLEEEYGDLRRVEHDAVADREQLHRFFGDTPLAVQLASGDGWTDLTFWTSNATRATREQRDDVDRMLDVWSADGARYVAAVGALYEYLEARPDRARALFTSFSDETPLQDDHESALLRDVRASMKQIIDRIDEAKGNAFAIDEEFDLVFNPFPALMSVHTPGPILNAEHFKRVSDDAVEIPRAGISDALQSLEGRWVSPDLLAIAVRSMGNTDVPRPEMLAAMKRTRTAGVSAGDIRQAIVKALQHSSVYRVRWTESH